MASKKSGGTAKNLRDSGPQYLGVKLYHGERAQVGSVLVRQRGTSIMAGTNVGTAKDHTLFALKPGVVSFAEKRKTNFNGQVKRRKIVHVK